MNNELRYILNGYLLLIVFFVTISIIKFCLSYNNKADINSDIAIQTNTDTKSNVTESEGKILFISNCASCHGLNRKLVGPALDGITDRVQDKILLHAWVKNSSKVLKSGNIYFKSLYKKYNKTEMTSFPNLTDNQIDEIISYVTSANKQYELPTPSVTL